MKSNPIVGEDYVQLIIRTLEPAKRKEPKHKHKAKENGDQVFAMSHKMSHKMSHTMRYGEQTFVAKQWRNMH